jgi:hypothetical protein
LSGREFSDEDTALLNDLWGGALFDILSAVLDKCASWEKSDQDAMVYMIIEQLAMRSAMYATTG